MNQYANPNERAPRPLFGSKKRAESGSAAGGHVKVIPLEDVVTTGYNEDSVTLPMPGEDGATQVMRPFETQEPIAAPGMESAVPVKSKGPVVGWLVIVSGPGRGHSIELGYERNSIGRNPESDVCLAYGDRGISDVRHVYVSYDRVGKKFFLSEGMGRNLAYCNGAPLFGHVELRTGDIIRVSETVLMFVAFCGEHVDWENFPAQLD